MTSIGPKLRGLGLISALDHSAGVYIFSVNNSEPLMDGLLPNGSVSIDLSSTIAQLTSLLEEEVTQDELFDMSQKAVSLKIDEKKQLSLIKLLSSSRGCS